MPLITTRTDNLPPGVTGGGGQAFTSQVQGNELAQNQIANITAQDSPLMRNAELRGQEVAARRGLLNSSIASGAAQRQVLDTAVPIGINDANTFANAARQNVDVLNQYEVADRGNASAERRANTAASAQVSSARIAADSAARQLQAQLSFQGEQADLGRAHSIVMSNLGLDQRLAERAFDHEINLDTIAANSFYDMQQMAALDNLNIRDQGMGFVMGAYNNFSNMVQGALEGNFDAAAQGRLIDTANNYLAGTIDFGTNLFQNFPAFNFEFTTFGS